MDEVRRLAEAGRPDEAIALVPRAAEAGDIEALLVLANWRLWGMYGPRSVDEGLSMLERAATAGSVDAARLAAVLAGNGLGRGGDMDEGRRRLAQIAARDPDAARQLAMLDAMPSEAEVAALPVETLSVDPEVRLVRGLLSRAACDYVREKAAPAMSPSLVIDPQTGRGVPDPVRNSSGMYFDPSTEDLVIHAVNRRIAAATGTGIGCGEMLHILRYDRAQEYRSHIDALTGAFTNQRHMTALVYLNDDYDGGETRFDQLEVTVKSRIGDCLIFRNADAAGRADLRTRHAGLPVRSGVKWLASRWIRENPHDPTTEL